jgi:predicted phage tail protein
MWSVKASADGITAGIGLVAGVDDEGDPISQVAVAATQFFVFDPNNPNPDGTMEALFYVDAEYGVCMQKAVIEQATIQVLNAQTIVADEVTAGIEIDSPDIKGGQIEIGNGFTVDSSGNMTANNATLNDATLNRVTANQGQFNNVVIAEDCQIEGTLSANQIKGDIVNAVGVTLSTDTTRTVVITDDQDFDRSIIIEPIVLTASAITQGEDEGDSTISLTIYWNDAIAKSLTLTQTGEGSKASAVSLVKDFPSGSGDLTIKIVVDSYTADGRGSPRTTCSDLCLLVAKKGSGGIIVS